MLDRARAAASRIVRLLTPAPAILLYHRVSRPDYDPWGIAVSPEAFNAQVGWLAKHRRPMTMDAFVSGLDGDHLPRGAVAITFDDGYLDNLIHAKPALERHRVPATLFVATGFIAEGGRFWWDRLADAILGSPGAANWTLAAGPEHIRVEWSASDRTDPDWRAWQPPPGPREQAFLAIWTMLQRLPASAHDLAIQEVESRHTAFPDAEARAMREEELIELLKGNLFSLGAHSVTHPALTSLRENDLRTELESSRSAAFRLQGRAVTGFAYPYGDMSSAVRAATAAAGFDWACSTEAASPPIKPSTEQKLALPRLVPPSGGATDLAAALRRL